MPLDDLSTECQSYSCALNVGIEARERLEDSLFVFVLYPDAVVFWRLERDNGGARVLVEVREGPQMKSGDGGLEAMWRRRLAWE